MVLLPSAPASAVDDYPADLRAPALSAVVDPWGFYNRNCTSFVAWRMNRNAGPGSFYNTMRGGRWGNAYDWAANAVRIGYPVNSTPAVGSIAWFSYGHVAYVELVNTNGTVTIEEYNVPAGSGTYNRRSIATSSAKYIHVKDLSSPAPVKQTVIVDDPAAELYGPSAYWWRAYIGYGGSMRYTGNECSRTTNYVIWRPILPVAGDWEVFVYVPGNYATTTCARYMVNAASVCGVRTVNQYSISNAWVSIGTYRFNAGNGGYVRLDDRTGEPANTRKVGVDAVKFQQR